MICTITERLIRALVLTSRARFCKFFELISSFKHLINYHIAAAGNERSVFNTYSPTLYHHPSSQEESVQLIFVILNYYV